MKLLSDKNVAVKLLLFNFLEVNLIIQSAGIFSIQGFISPFQESYEMARHCCGGLARRSALKLIYMDARNIWNKPDAHFRIIIPPNQWRFSILKWRRIRKAD